MEVSSSAFLREQRPLLRELLERLCARYEYASILAADTRSKRYTVSGMGVSASEDALFTKRGFVVRVLDGKGYGEFSFNHISHEEIPEILERIDGELMAARQMPEGITAPSRPVPDEEMRSFAASTEYEIHPEELGDEKILAHLTRIREAGTAADAKILDCLVMAHYQEIHKLFLSAKKDLEQNVMWTSGALMMLASRGEELKRCYEGYSNLGGAEVLSSMEQDVARVARSTIELLDSEPIVPGEYECVCDPNVTGMIVHEAFGHGVEMDMFVKDRALAASCIGEYVASPLVTMHDGAAAAKEAGTYFFDDEGTEAHDTVIIEKGILRRGISDLVSAQTLGTEPTGNGRRESYERKAYPRMTNTWFEGGKDSVEDMITSVKYGFLLEQPSSGMEDPKNWGIQCMVTTAREIRDGKLTGKIFSPIVLTGYVPDLLKSISMMSGDVKLAGGGMCGKGHKEWVKVSDGGPYIKARIQLG